MLPELLKYYEIELITNQTDIEPNPLLKSLKQRSVDWLNPLETLWRDKAMREKLGENGKRTIRLRHSPELCGKKYAEAIEHAYKEPSLDFSQNISISPSPKLTPRQKQLLVDVSRIAHNDIKTGIQRVVRAQLLELMKTDSQGLRTLPVYLSEEGGSWHYRYANNYALKILEIPTSFALEDFPVEVHAGDILYIPDFSKDTLIPAGANGLFDNWKKLGVRINVLIYDLMPIQRPDFFPPLGKPSHIEWLKIVSRVADLLIGISHTVTQELLNWLESECPYRNSALRVTAVPLGGDIEASFPSTGLPNPDILDLLQKFKHAKTFLMVGTIIPRKAHLQTISAFEELWKCGEQETLLVIVGKETWKNLPENIRGDIPETVKKITEHPALNERLFWLNDVSDEFLQEIYKVSTCLLFPSEAEGFGLPLIEAARYQIPIIARDIPVIREVASDGAFYFKGLKPSDLKEAIEEWLALHKKDQIPSSARIKWNTWARNVEILKSALFDTSSNDSWTLAHSNPSILLKNFE